MKATFKQDIPSKRWVADKVEEAEEGGLNRWGVPRRFGPVTGSFSRALMLPTALLAPLRGQRGEQDAPRQKSLEYILANWERLKNEAVYIEIDPFGQPWVSEGNHRIMVANELGEPNVLAEVKYFSGSQLRAPVAWQPKQLLGYDEHASARMTQNKRQPSPLDNPAFRNWFRNSKVVDDDGEPLVVYHGGFDVIHATKPVFKPSPRGAFGRGTYFSPHREYAKSYADRWVGRDNEPGTVGEYYVRVENPFIVPISYEEYGHPIVWSLIALGWDPVKAAKRVEKDEEEHGEVSKVLETAAKARGYDGLFVLSTQSSVPLPTRISVPNDVNEVVIWNIYDVKSAFENDGKFSRDNPAVTRNPRRWR